MKLSFYVASLGYTSAFTLAWAALAGFVQVDGLTIAAFGFFVIMGLGGGLFTSYTPPAPPQRPSAAGPRDGTNPPAAPPPPAHPS